MGFTVYNTLTRRKELFKPLKDNTAGIYTCGPTVYLFAHIGNMRTYIFEDGLVRALKFFGYSVKRVMNITDVGHLVSDSDEGEDKMEVGARREGKSAWDIAKFYTEAFFKDYKALNCLMPDVLCPATEYIREMIELVLALEKKGFTYRTGDGVYFDTARLPDYGKLAGKSHMEGIQEGARVEVNAEKRNPHDFALWKFSPAGEKRQMEWPSPWGTGFPGWHIECSAMAMKHLGGTIDIHCGGEDHVAIHHTNEIAQSEAATGKPFANYWMHGRFLVTGDTGKMSKSAGGFLTVSTLPEKGYDPLAYRYYCFLTHYRKQLEFTWEGLEAAARGLDGLRGLAEKLRTEVTGEPPAADRDAKYFKDFKEALADDVNLPEALAGLWETLKNFSIPAPQRLAFALAAEEVLALGLFSAKERQELPAELAALIKEREAARKAKDFKRSDELRKALAGKGVLIEDVPGGTRWKLSRG
ncbi:MAG: cysteine--tRNA ligase [Elusimicrobia bacterium GWF2_52_66]|nr:MAG: cysteine--tRNA ligase [Elusimicrobia bacterium GWA2_51_34]OGR87570.1 MAG: cysteine--tRNA ligase [Elusimicrobia bacterium GWF2_52_66]HAF95487.1 cysteine--tRNA ligase [Elusimicrobiota bacterium]HCE97227.1 cysteine--tRNA ligase [Elusimicrobiota bacterium]